MTVGEETPGICGISALNRSLGGWLGWSGMRYSPTAAELLEIFNSRAVDSNANPVNSNTVLPAKAVQSQLYARETSRATSTTSYVARKYAERRSLRALLVKRLQNSAECLSPALGHPTVVIEKRRPIFGSVSRDP